MDALSTLCRRLDPQRLLITPTVFQELVYLADAGDTVDDRRKAARAMQCLAKWKLDLVNIVPVGYGLVEQIADRFQEIGLLPAEEHNDGLILAEAALLDCAILLSGDAHLRGIDFQRASFELKSFGLQAPVIATPREIVAKFF
jgi:hypothetical protein